MDAIENILKENNQDYIYAKIDGERCHPGNSYKATNCLIPFDEKIFIECDTEKEYENSIYLDHHKEGDFGYDKKYHLFLEASSIGQLIAYLIDNDSYIAEPEDFYVRACFTGYMYFKKHGWYYRKSLNEFIKIPQKIVLIAAGDHSLCECYKGLCSGVEKNDLFQERIFEIASNFNDDVELIQRTMNKYKFMFLERSDEILDLRDLNLGIGYSVDYLCLRELAIMNNQAILVKTKDNEESLERIMFLSLNEEVATSIIKNKAYKDIHLENIFGVPIRGYVGGYIIQ